MRSGGEIERKRLLPKSLSVLALERARGAGIVDQDIHSAAKGAQRRLGDRATAHFGCHSADGDGRSRCAEAGRPSGHLLQRLPPPSGQHQPYALTRQRLGNTRADAGARPGHQGRSPAQLQIHRTLPSARSLPE